MIWYFLFTDQLAEAEVEVKAHEDEIKRKFNEKAAIQKALAQEGILWFQLA